MRQQLALQLLRLMLCMTCARRGKGSGRDACAACGEQQAGRVGPEAEDPVRRVRARRPAACSAGALLQ